MAMFLMVSFLIISVEFLILFLKFHHLAFPVLAIFSFVLSILSLIKWHRLFTSENEMKNALRKSGDMEHL